MLAKITSGEQFSPKMDRLDKMVLDTYQGIYKSIERLTICICI